MLIATIWDRGVALLPAAAWRGVLAGGGVTLAVALFARRQRGGLLGGFPAGLGVAIGWWVMTGMHMVRLAPARLGDRLALLAAGVLVLAVAAERFGPARHRRAACLAVTALFCGWWLGGMPGSQAALAHAWPLVVGVAVAAGAGGAMATEGAMPAFRAAAAAAALAGALHVVHAPALWWMLALVPAAAGLAAMAAAEAGGLLPLGVDIAALGAMADLAFGRLPRGGLAAADLAALAPLATLWLAPRIGARLGGASRIAPAVGAVAAALLAVGIVWAAGWVLPLR